MKLRLFVLSVLLTCTISCKKEKEEAKEIVTQEVANPAPLKFVVEADIVTDKPDNFGLFYTVDGTIGFDGDKAIWVDEKPGSQKIVVSLPDDVVPTHIRVDFGAKQKELQGNVTLKNFKMTFGDKSFEFKGSDFFTYFFKNESIETEIDNIAGTVVFKQNLKKGVSQFFYPQQILADEIAKLTK